MTCSFCAIGTIDLLHPVGNNFFIPFFGSFLLDNIYMFMGNRGVCVGIIYLQRNQLLHYNALKALLTTLHHDALAGKL